MVTVDQVIEANSRARSPEAVATLANDIRVSGVNIRPQDPIQVWESHPAVSKVLDEMKDREIALAIQLANQEVA